MTSYEILFGDAGQGGYKGYNLCIHYKASNGQLVKFICKQLEDSVLNDYIIIEDYGYYKKLIYFDEKILTFTALEKYLDEMSKVFIELNKNYDLKYEDKEDKIHV